MKLLFLFLCSSAIFIYSESANVNVCNSDLCKKSADSLKKSMNFNIDPCDNFYEYVCGNFKNTHEIVPEYMSASWFTERTKTVTEKTKEFLTKKNEANEPKSVHKARTLYSSCLDTDTQNSKGLKPIEKILKQVGLSVNPPLKGTKKFNWLKTQTAIGKLIGQDSYISFGVSRDPKNQKINRIAIAKPTDESSLLPLMKNKRIRKQENQYLMKDDSSGINDSIEDYVNYIDNIFMKMAEYAGVKTTSMSYKRQKQKAETSVIIQIANLGRLTQSTHPNDSAIPITMTLKELQNYTDSIATDVTGKPLIDWSEFIRYMFEGTPDIQIDYKTGQETILVSDLGYFSDLIKSLRTTSAFTHEVYLWWHVVSSLIPYSIDDMRSYKYDYEYSILQTNNSLSRESFCVDAVSKMMGMAVSYLFTENTRFNETKYKAKNMVENLRYAFREIVKSTEWMEEDMKSITLAKADAMRSYVAFPDWLYNATALDILYDDLEVVKTDFMGTVLKSIQNTVSQSLATLRTINEEEEEISGVEPISVNAFYSPEHNAIVLPVAIVAFPFHGNGLESLNYGSLGTILGHEITHGFDNTGRQFNSVGNVDQWWQPKTLQEYQKRANCFIESYNRFQYGSDNVDGILTLDENIADNGGFREALLAYRKYVADNGEEPLLQGFETFSQEQLLSISFANTWCYYSTSELLAEAQKSDVHSPNSVRVLGVLSNSKDFATTWNCKKGSKMNPDQQKCHIW